MPYYDEDDHEAINLAAEDQWRRQQLARLMQNPDCRDPDHPGCDNCLEDDDELEGAQPKTF